MKIIAMPPSLLGSACTSRWYTVVPLTVVMAPSAS
ncbi:hypothetical protein R2APBS1_0245 [Rhodanobacter denitrificans]|uniref:Uncharacterized protein n=1 Tax=Rhodanobacter denitrificans TaxID=666685 RepID=M4NHX2_9GAMM|nr:hypothetical protein R2APBS1_0245 [Rhodanobacter denitrificans]